MDTLEALTKIGNCQTQVNLPVSKFKRKEYQTLQQSITKTNEVILECIKLLDIEGINSKKRVKEKLEKLV